MVVSDFKLVSFHRFFLILVVSESVGPGEGVILMIVTGPITHQSPVINWPDFVGLSKVQVMPYWEMLFRFSVFEFCATTFLWKQRRRKDPKISFSQSRKGIEGEGDIVALKNIVFKFL